MVIDYRSYDIMKFIGRNTKAENGNPVYLEKNNSCNEKAITPYRTKEVQKERVHTETVRKGLFGKKVEEKRIPITAYDPIEESKGFAFISGNSTGYADYACSLSYIRDGWRSKEVTIDPELLMPALITQPENLEEAISIVKIDPRFLIQIDPTICKSKEDLKQLCSAAVEGHDNILDYQKKLGIVTNEAEIAERERFTDVCEEYGVSFINAYTRLNAKQDKFKQTFGNVK